MFCISTIKSKSVFIQVALKVLFLKATMISSKKYPLDQRGNQVYARQNAFFIFGFCLENFMMRISLFLKLIVSLPAIGHNSASGFNIRLDKWHELFSGTIFDHLKPDATHLFPFLLSSYHNCKFVFRATAPFPAVLTTNINFINFDFTRKLFPFIPDCAPAKFMEPCPRGIITAKSKKRFKREGTDSGFSGCKPPQCLNHSLSFLRVPLKIVPAVREWLN